MGRILDIMEKDGELIIEKVKKFSRHDRVKNKVNDRYNKTKHTRIYYLTHFGKSATTIIAAVLLFYITAALTNIIAFTVSYPLLLLLLGLFIITGIIIFILDRIGIFHNKELETDQECEIDRIDERLDKVEDDINFIKKFIISLKDDKK